MLGLTYGVLALLGSVYGQYDKTQSRPDCGKGPLSENAICDTSLSTADRVKGLISALTIKEKVQLTGYLSPGVPRLGLPPYNWWSEALHGVADAPGVFFADKGEFSYATAFPQPYTMGAAFDDHLIYEVARVTSIEGRAFSNAKRAGVNFWSPDVNLYRDPRWGRGQEVPGEDAYHVKRYAKAFVRGMQGDDPDRWRTAATCKHVAAYDIEDWQGRVRYGLDLQVSIQDLAEYYMQPFQTCARDSKVAALMCSYNAVNGTPACADSYLMEDIVRKHWGWTDEGSHVVSDCGAIRYGFSDHDFRPERQQMVAESLNAGVDLDCGYYYPDYLEEALRNGLIAEATIDQALERLYSALVKTGFFDSDDPYRALSWSDVGGSEADALALRAAEEGVVLLKNDEVLPLKLDRKLKIVVFGSWMNATVEMQGNYQGKAKSIKTPLAALQELENVEVITANWQISKFALVKEVKPDVVIAIDGIRTMDAMETRDRTLIEWPHEMSDVVLSMEPLGVPVIVVNMAEQFDSGLYLRNPASNAVIWAGYGGQSGGEALANIISGKAAPAGRLPVTQYPLEYVYAMDMTDMNLRGDPKTGRLGRTYRWFDNATLPFGFGLHYTEFEIAPQLSTTSLDIAELLKNCKGPLDLCPLHTFKVEVTNSGKVKSDFSLLAFVASEVGPKPFPLRTLVAYDRLSDIEPEQTKTASLELTLGSLARHDEQGNQILYPGQYTLMFDEPTQAVLGLILGGKETVLDHWPQPRER